jgi:hypothetical protein
MNLKEHCSKSGASYFEIQNGSTYLRLKQNERESGFKKSTRFQD